MFMAVGTGDKHVKKWCLALLTSSFPWPPGGNSPVPLSWDCKLEAPRLEATSRLVS